MTKEAIKRYLSVGTQADRIYYNRFRAIAKRAVCQNRHETWNMFVTMLEHDVTKLKLGVYKMTGILNNDIVEHFKINPIKKETWLNYFQDLSSR
jgi:hypothetical protein